MNILAILFSVGIPALFLLIIYSLDLYASRSFQLVLLCTAWGAIGAYAIALFLNSRVGIPLMVSFGVPRAMLVAAISVYFAPIVEELAKALSLVYISRRSEFTYFVDGAIYGFAAGIGFSIRENFLYINQNPDQAVLLALLRAFSTCLMHGAAAGLVGAAVGRFRFQQRRSGRGLGVIGGLVAAMLLHALFNRFAGELPVVGIVFGLLGVIGIGMVIGKGLREQRAWLSETLGRQVGVTAAEVRAAQAYGGLDDLLRPIISQFPKKAEEIENLLLCQAQLGIKRKVQERIETPKLRAQLDAEVEELQQRMERLRGEVGPYIMTYLRGVFPEGAFDLWARLELVAAQTGPADLQRWMQMANLIETRSTEPPKQDLFARLQAVQAEREQPTAPKDEGQA